MSSNAFVRPMPSRRATSRLSTSRGRSASMLEPANGGTGCDAGSPRPLPRRPCAEDARDGSRVDGDRCLFWDRVADAEPSVEPFCAVGALVLVTTRPALLSLSQYPP